MKLAGRFEIARRSVADRRQQDLLRWRDGGCCSGCLVLWAVRSGRLPCLDPRSSRGVCGGGARRTNNKTSRAVRASFEKSRSVVCFFGLLVFSRVAKKVVFATNKVSSRRSD